MGQKSLEDFGAKSKIRFVRKQDCIVHVIGIVGNDTILVLNHKRIK